VGNAVNRNDRSIVALVSLAHGMVHTYELSIPLFVSIWLVEFSTIDLGVTQVAVTTATLGLVVTAGYGLFGAGALPGGVLVDRIGSRQLIRACLFGMGGSFLLLAVAPELVTITIALLVWGLAASVYHPAGLTLLSKGVEERGTGFAYHGIAGNIGQGGGPLATTVLLLFLDWTVVAGLLAVPALLAGVYASQANFDETAAVTATADGGSSKAASGVDSLAAFSEQSRLLFAGGFALVFVVALSSGLYYRGVLTFLPAVLESIPGFEPFPLSAVLPAEIARAIGGGSQVVRPERYFYAGLLTVGVFGQFAGGKLSDRIRVERGLVLGFGALALLALGFSTVAAAGVVPLAVLGAAIGFCLFFVQPFTQATVAEYSPADARGLSYGYTYLGVFGVGAAGGAVAGAVLTYAAPAELFVVLAGIAVVASGVGFVLLRRSRRLSGA
jgi:MFS family permease